MALVGRHLSDLHDGRSPVLLPSAIIEGMNDDIATRVVVSAATALITIAGLMITLIWGLIDETSAAAVGTFIRAATALLAFSIFLSLVTLQYVIAGGLKSNDGKVIADNSYVRTVYLLAWLAFLAGVSLVTTAVFKITLDGGAAG